MYANKITEQHFADPSTEFEISFQVYLIIIKIKKNLEYLHELLLDASQINVPNIPLVIREQLITEILETQRTILQQFKRTFCCPEPISEVIEELVNFFDDNLNTSVDEEGHGEENYGRYVYEHTAVSEYQFSCLNKFKNSIEHFIECEDNHKQYKRIVSGEEDLQDLKREVSNPDIMELYDRSTLRTSSYNLLECSWKENFCVNQLFLEKLKLPLTEIPFEMKQLLWDVVAVMKIGYKTSKQLKTPKTLFLIQTVLDVLQTLIGHFLEPLLYMIDKEFQVLHKALTTKVFIRTFHLQNRLLGDVEEQVSNTPCNSLSDSSESRFSPESLLSPINPMQNEKLLRLFPPIPMIDGLPIVEIHIPSLGYSERQRQKIKRFDVLQGRQVLLQLSSQCDCSN